MIKEDEESKNIQKIYKGYLDKIIDSELVLSYQMAKKSYDFYTANQLDEYIIDHFEKTTIAKLAQKISYCTRKKDSISYYSKMLEQIYNSYQQGLLTENMTTEFYNEILNDQQNSYFHITKKVMINRFTKGLNLTDKKRGNLENGYFLIKALQFLEKRDYKHLNIKEEDLKLSLEDTHTRLSRVKMLNRTYHLTSDDYHDLDDLFLDNKLTHEVLKEKYPFFCKRQLNMIRSKYCQALLPYLENMDFTDLKIKRINVGYHENHLKFYDFSMHYANVLTFIATLNISEICIILNQYKKVKPFFQLLPLVDWLPSFKMETFKNIIIYYPKIEKALIEKREISPNPSINVILKKLPAIIRLSRLYANADCYTYAILGEERINKILDTDSRISDLKSYIDAYIGILKRSQNTIPPLHGEFGDYIYESGNANIDRLLIGANCYGSCITPHYTGEETYYRVLTEKDADVLTIYNKKNHHFVARSFLFRKNNFIVMAPIYGIDGKENKNLYREKFLLQISNQLLSTAKAENDNLDYIFLTKNGKERKVNFPVVTDRILKSDFPHSDLNYDAYLLECKEERLHENGIELINEKIREVASGTLYNSRRMVVQKKTADYQEEIQRIKALEIISTEDKKQKKELKKEFDFLLKTDFDEVYLGQDWYLAILQDKIVSRSILPTYDNRQIGEISMVEQQLLETSKESTHNEKNQRVFMKRKD